MDDIIVMEKVTFFPRNSTDPFSVFVSLRFPFFLGEIYKVLQKSLQTLQVTKGWEEGDGSESSRYIITKSRSFNWMSPKEVIHFSYKSLY